ncbi:MAG: DUF3373 family protein [Thermodesulfobacteriota bacterium]
MKIHRSFKTFGAVFGAMMLLACCIAPPGIAQQNPEELKKDELKKEVRHLKDRIKDLEKDNEWNTEDIGSLMDRLDEAEMHTATDKISFGVDFRTRAESIHYQDIQAAPQPFISQFFGLSGLTKSQIQQQIENMDAAGMIPEPEEYDADNDIIYTNRLRLNIMGRFNRHLDFRGRLTAYKVFGDSTGVKFNQGGLNDITLDGNTAGLPHGDTVRVDRAYFVYKNQLGQVPISFSAGRRPSTDGPPLEYRNYSLVGGSPMATIINWQFDGASLTFGMEDTIGIPGASVKLCYGVGYESDWGNASSLNQRADLEDVHMLGFISDLYDNGSTSLMFNFAHAWDITDGFTGLSVMPFTVAKNNQGTPGDPTDDTYNFSQNNGAFISRLEPTTNIGDWDAASLLLRSQIDTPDDHIDWFVSGSWSHTDPTGISTNPFYEIMDMGLLSTGELESRDGYSVYAGTVFPMPHDARLGLEYNWGSKYWLNFTGAEDSLIGSKLATRGEVYEAYYHQPIFGRNFFVTLGGQFYDYEYTGSGNPLGKPEKIDEINALSAINPVTDKVWNTYLSATVNF